LAGIVLLGVSAIWLGERRKVDVPPGPAPILYLIADTEQELTRMPVSFTRMSDAEEIAIGNQLARAYAPEERENATRDPEKNDVESYLTQVGSRLAAQAHRKLPYRFHYIPDQYFINAFALPGGHVYLGEGMLRLMDSEDELAAVLGHEIEHIDHYHCAERAQQEQALRKIPLGGLFAIPVEVFEAGYSKDQELEADREGARLAVQAGYSANGAIRMFETFQRLYEEYQARARTPQQEMSQVAQQTIEGYFRSHPFASERIAQIQRLAAEEHWPLHAERDLRVAYVFRSAEAAEALHAGRYTQAQQLALQSLKLHPDHPRALEVLARAQFAQADFAAAAETYRRLFELDPSRPEAAENYAMALAAADRQRAAATFRHWAESLPHEEAMKLDVPSAGLALLAGDPAPAKELQAKISVTTESSGDPNALAQLGWWYYLAGDYETADNLVGSAAQLRVGNARFLTELGWIDIERRRLADSLQELGSIYGGPDVPSNFTMAEAVAFWQGGQSDQALTRFETANESGPEWKNPRWVKALYGPSVEPSLEQMQQEQERRRRASQRH